MTGTWEDSYPYNANSTFALHPQFIRLPAAGVVEDDEYRTLRNELNALSEIDYERVNRHKLRLLRRAFERHGTRTAALHRRQQTLAHPLCRLLHAARRNGHARLYPLGRLRPL